mgnify:CR=1 FL=1
MPNTSSRLTDILDIALVQVLADGVGPTEDPALLAPRLPDARVPDPLTPRPPGPRGAGCCGAAGTPVGWGRGGTRSPASAGRLMRTGSESVLLTRIENTISSPVVT